MARRRRSQPVQAPVRRKSPWFEQLEDRRLLTSNWTNIFSPLDASGDGTIGQDDVALILQELGRPQVSAPADGRLPANVTGEHPLYDVDGDGYVSPIDAVRVRNWVRNTGWQPGQTIGSLTNALFPSWTRLMSGGGEGGKGSIKSVDGVAVLSEGNSFYVGMEASFTAPSTPSALRFVFDQVQFDTSALSRVKDALEIALLDEAGNPLTQGYALGRDAAFNLTEGAAAAAGSGVAVNGNEITIGLTGITAGTKGRIVVRLINNDGDVGTSVTLREVALISSPLQAVKPAGPIADQVPRASIPPTSTPSVDPSDFALQSAIGFNSTTVTSYRQKTTVFVDNFDNEHAGIGSLDYTGFSKWDVTAGSVDLLGRGLEDVYTSQGLYVDLDGGSPAGGTLRTKETLVLTPGDYELRFRLGNNNTRTIAPNTVTVSLGNAYRETFTRYGLPPVEEIVRSFRVASPLAAHLIFQQLGADDDGIVLDDVRLSRVSPASSGLLNSVDFTSSASEFAFNGNAKVTQTGDGSVVRLVDANYWEAGSIFSQNTLDARRFSTSFTFRITGRGGLGNGADGIVFVVQSVSSSLGASGGGIGYQGIQHSIGVEFDTFDNGGNEPGSNHVGVDVNGDVAHEVGHPYAVEVTPDFDNGEIWHAWVDYDGTNLQVRVSPTTARPAEATVSRPLDLVSILGGNRAYVGFTSGTGLGFGNHDILSWGFSEGEPVVSNETISISAVSPTSIARSGAPLTVAGLVELVEGNSRGAQFTRVTVNGQDVAALDSSGLFNAVVLVAPGENDYEFVGYTNDGRTVATSLKVQGLPDQEMSLTAGLLDDVTSSMDARYERTSFVESANILDATLSLHNKSASDVKYPLFVAVKNISVPSVAVAGAAGFTTDGLPYYEVDGPAGTTLLQSNGESPSLTLSFDDPGRVPFTYDLVILAPKNQAPDILSYPVTAAAFGEDYAYPVVAYDRDGDPLTYRLTTAPAGVTIDSQGRITWPAQKVLEGTFPVTVVVSDGRLERPQDYRLTVTRATTSSVSGLNFEDFNENGLRDASAPVGGSTVNDAGLAGFRIYIDANGNNQFDVGEIFALTQSDGSYELPNLPVGTYVIREAGKSGWKQTGPAGGEYVVEITAGGQRITGVNFANTRLTNDNAAPLINSHASISVVGGATYRYQIDAVDPEGETLTYLLAGAPQGMSVEANGLVTWTTTSLTPDASPITLTVKDARGLSATETWSIDVLADVTAPSVSIEVLDGSHVYGPEGVVDLNSDYSVRLRAYDNAGVRSLTLFVDGVQVALDSAGVAHLHAVALGTKALRAVATDISGLTAESTGAMHIVDPAVRNRPIATDPTLPQAPTPDPTDFGRPLVDLISPDLGATVANKVPIIGTVDDPENNLWYWRVYYGRADLVSITSIDVNDPDWTLLKQGTNEVVAGQLAELDTALLAANSYSILLVGFDGNGRGYADGTTVHVANGVQLGNFHLEFTDLTIPLAGIPITITRAYDTINATRQGDFGYGWTMAVADPQIVESLTLGVGGGLDYSTDKFVPDRTKVYLTDPHGDRVGFTYREQLTVNTLFGAVLRPYFEPDPGVYDTLAIDETQVIRGGFAGALVAGINPDAYTLTTKEGLSYQYDQTAGLQSIRDMNGNVVTITPSGIIHSGGEAIEFRRDAAGRIADIIDPAGNTLHYVYDTAGDLREFHAQTGDTTRYSYVPAAPHYLDEAIDPRANRALKAVYEPNPDTGVREYKGVFDALGNRVDDRNFDLRAHTGVVRDANGNATTLVFDARGNILRETDPLGHVTTREYNDPRNPDLETRIVDALGYVTEKEYDARGNLLVNRELGVSSTPYASPLITRFSYNAANKVTSVTDARGAETQFRYDGPNLIEIENALHDIAHLSYFASGDVKSFRDFNGNVTTFADYVGGQPRLVTYADGTYRRLQYNVFGQTTQEDLYEAGGKLTQHHESRYDSAGRLIEESIGSDSDGSKTDRRLFYDGNLLDWEIVVNPASLNGQGVLQESPSTPIAQRKSSITDYQYNAAGRLIRQIDAEGGIVDFRYDAQGNRIALRDPVGNITTWLYDALNQPIEERDPLYWDAVRHSSGSYMAMSDDQFLDAVAPLVVTIGANPLYDDPSGAGWATKTPAEHVTLTAYDAAGNVIGTIDRDARRIEYTVDQLKNVTEERWYSPAGELVRTLSYSYDAAGNVLTAHDPESSRVFTYDALSRLQTADNAGTPNVPRVLLTYAYDAMGNVTSVSDQFGVTVASTYNSRNLLDSRSWFDAILSGGAAEVDPIRINFHYDAAGRETQLDRYRDLAATDLVGHVHRSYDLASRSKAISFTDALDAAYADYGFGYDSLGRMTSDSRAGVTAQYGYDRTGQLLSAKRSNGNDEAFSYDLNGNRTLPGYVTGPGNRLMSDGDYNYGYDGEGNRTSKTEIATGEITRYEYDYRNRLARVTEQQVGSNAVEVAGFVYDARNQRIVASEGTTVSTTAYDRDSPWVTFDGVVSERYLIDDGVDFMLALGAGEATTNFIDTELIGSVVDTLSLQGSVSNQIAYAAFGASHASELLARRIGFAGRVLSAVDGIYYNRARYYDSATGRFLSLDPLGFQAGDTNLFRYVSNQPLALRDPSGNVTALEYNVLTVAAAIGAFDLKYYKTHSVGQSICSAIEVISIRLTLSKVPLLRIPKSAGAGQGAVCLLLDLFG